MKALSVFVLLVIAVISVSSLLSGASFIGTVLPGGLPLGNAIAAFGLISPAAVAVLLSPTGSPVRVVALIVFCAAVAWLPVSIALAGNLALNFTGWRGSIWMGLTLVVNLAVLCTLAWAVVHRFFVMRWHAKCSLIMKSNRTPDSSGPARLNSNQKI